MAFEVEKHGKFVVVVETVNTAFIGIACLAGIIMVIILSSGIYDVDPQSTPPVPTPTQKWADSYDSDETGMKIGQSSLTLSDSDARTVLVGLATGLSLFFLAVFFVNLYLLIVLWKGVIRKQSGKCCGWYTTQAIFCGLDMLAFLFSFTVGYPILDSKVYFSRMIYYCYRVFSIYVIRSYEKIQTASLGAQCCTKV